ncbi:MAG: efflux RND transporter periplasmic adaptor subunit, partial [Hyphomicrobiaceae bacterium]|nr:efflux RND transporter periplasmic adaptor subunit [Hyphomicrobiaceae bacterium]
AMNSKWALGAIIVGAGAVLAYGGPQKALTDLTNFTAQMRSDTSGSLRPAPQTTNAGPTKSGTAPPPAAVTVSKPLIRKVTEWDEYTGRFDAVDSVEIRARISGYLDQVHFKDGQNVKKGDLLFSIDPRPFERALDLAKAEYSQAKTKSDNAALDVDRGKPLVDRKIMSEKVFDDRSNVLREAQSTIKVTEAKIKTAELDLFFAKITAPISGRISKSNMTAGGWVSAGAASNTTLLTTIVSEDPIHIYFDISENNWLKYRRMVEKGQKTGAAQVGAPIELALPDEKGFPHKGIIDFVDNRMETTTGTLRGRAIVDNKKGTFSAGMFARVRVQGSENYDAVMLPDSAIGTDQTNKFALTVSDDGTVARKAVELGPIIDGLRVIRTGLTANDTVIIKGLQRARPGGKVAPKTEPIKISDAAAAVSSVAPASKLAPTVK